jgi:hypothetical protein
MAQIRPGGARRDRQDVERSLRCLDVTAGEELLDAAVVTGLLSAGAARDPAA